jgi:V-type H+-transporting ATPase subunit E
MCQLLEPTLVIRCRQVDQPLLEQVIPGAVSDYKAKVNKDCQIKLDTENWLGADCTGGIEILAQKGKIKVDNTLEARLDMIAKQILPGIRTKLFGTNPSRKFTD